MNERLIKYDDLSHKLIYFDEEKIKNLTSKKIKGHLRWGESGTISISGTKVFYKKLPLAKKFFNSGINTSNLYKIPAYYNYGYGSAGVNPWRELVTHINLSNYVIQGETTNFPLLYHWRIIMDDGKSFESGLTKKLSDRFGNNKNIIKYLTDRYECEYKIIMFLEHIPYVLYEFMEKNHSYITKYIQQSEKILKFLESKGILDSDAHWGNYLVDANFNLYLTDFGLVLDKNFMLDDNEKKYIKKNKKIPYYYSLKGIYDFVYWYVEKKHKKINELFYENLKNIPEKLNKNIVFISTFIKSIDHIIKISQLPKIYSEIIMENKDKIIKINLLKYKLTTQKNKNVFISDKNK